MLPKNEEHCILGNDEEKVFFIDNKLSEIKKKRFSHKSETVNEMQVS